jgi:hypothetical protein
MPISLPKPDLSLRVGIVGNRNFDWLDESDATAVSTLESAILRAFEEVFASLDQVVGTVAEHSKDPARFSEAIPRIKIISALAKGGDQLGTMAAMEPKGGTPRQCRFEFHGLMPFPADQFPRTVAGQTSNENFSERDLERHDRLISKAASIVRLDGIYQKATRPKDEPNDSDEVKAARDQQYEAAEAVNRPRRYRAYRAQALMLLQHSDMVIAIWDRSAVGKSGGTEEAVIEALRVGIPVVHIQPSRMGAEIRYLFRKKDAGRVINDGIWKDSLDTAIIKLLAFPSDVPAILVKTQPDEKNHAGAADAPGAKDPSPAKVPSSKKTHHGEGHSGDPTYDPEFTIAEFFLAPKEFQYRSRPKTKAAWDRFERFFRIELRKDEVIDETETKGRDCLNAERKSEDPVWWRWMRRFHWHEARPPAVVGKLFPHTFADVIGAFR